MAQDNDPEGYISFWKCKTYEHLQKEAYSRFKNLKEDVLLIENTIIIYIIMWDTSR